MIFLILINAVHAVVATQDGNDAAAAPPHGEMIMYGEVYSRRRMMENYIETIEVPKDAQKIQNDQEDLLQTIDLTVENGDYLNPKQMIYYNYEVTKKNEPGTLKEFNKPNPNNDPDGYQEYLNVQKILKDAMKTKDVWAQLKNPENNIKETFTVTLYSKSKGDKSVTFKWVEPEVSPLVQKTKDTKYMMQTTPGYRYMLEMEPGLVELYFPKTGKKSENDYFGSNVAINDIDKFIKLFHEGEVDNIPLILLHKQIHEEDATLHLYLVWPISGPLKYRECRIH